MMSDDNNQKPFRANKGVQDIPLLLKPFYRLYHGARVGIHLLSLKKVQNPMKKPGLPPKEESRMYFLDPYDHKTFNANRKIHKSTFIDTLHAILG